MRIFTLVCLLSLTSNFAHAHDPYEITSVVYVRSNIIELFIEMEFPAGMRLAGVEPVRDVAALMQFEKAQPQLYALAGGFFDFTAGNNQVAALTTNVALGAESHLQFKLEYAATPLRPLQFTAQGLRGSADSPYGTSLTVLDMVHQKVLGQTTLFANSARADFPSPPPTENEPVVAPAPLSPVAPTNTATATSAVPLTTSAAPAEPAPVADRPSNWIVTGVFLAGLFLSVFIFFRRRE